MQPTPKLDLIKRHWEDLSLKFEDEISEHLFEASLAHLANVSTYDAIKRRLIEVRKTLPDIDPDQLIRHLYALHFGLSIKTPLDQPKVIEMQQFTLSRVMTFEEAFALGFQLENCVKELDRFKREADRANLYKIERNRKVTGLISLTKVAFNKWAVTQLKGKNNNPIEEESVLRQLLKTYFKEHGCTLIEQSAFASDRINYREQPQTRRHR